MRGLGRGIHVDFVHQEVRFVSQSGGFPHVSSKDLAQLSEMFLHIGDSILQLSGLSVPVFQAAPQHAASLTAGDPGLRPNDRVSAPGRAAGAPPPPRGPPQACFESKLKYDESWLYEESS